VLRIIDNPHKTPSATLLVASRWAKVTKNCIIALQTIATTIKISNCRPFKVENDSALCCPIVSITLHRSASFMWHCGHCMGTQAHATYASSTCLSHIKGDHNSLSHRDATTADNSRYSSGPGRCDMPKHCICPAYCEESSAVSTK
jgi:hypothetical protein